MVCRVLAICPHSCPGEEQKCLLIDVQGLDGILMPPVSKCFCDGDKVPLADGTCGGK